MALQRSVVDKLALENTRKLAERLRASTWPRSVVCLDESDALICAIAVERYIKQEEGLMRDRDECAAKATVAGQDYLNKASPVAGDPLRQDGFDFGYALHCLRQGRRIARRRWGHCDMFLALHTPAAHERMTDPYVYIRSPHGTVEPVHLCNLDLLATDWYDAGPA
jgi:hypothetical protein